MCVQGGGGNVPLKRAGFSPFANRWRLARAVTGVLIMTNYTRTPTFGRLDNRLGGWWLHGNLVCRVVELSRVELIEFGFLAHLRAH